MLEEVPSYLILNLAVCTTANASERIKCNFWCIDGTLCKSN
jgi:hypothetical protein